MQNDVIAHDTAVICERVKFDALRDKTILVTGASGLLGTYFLATLAHLKQSGMPLKAIAQFHSEPAPHTAEIIRQRRIPMRPGESAGPRRVFFPAAGRRHHPLGRLRTAGNLHGEPCGYVPGEHHGHGHAAAKAETRRRVPVFQFERGLQRLEEIPPERIRHRHDDAIASRAHATLKANVAVRRSAMRIAPKAFALYPRGSRWLTGRARAKATSAR